MGKDKEDDRFGYGDGDLVVRQPKEPEGEKPKPEDKLKAVADAAEGLANRAGGATK